MSPSFQSYIEVIRACTLCAHEMDRAPNPILQVSESAKVLIAGQAPGNLADTTGKPFNDPSGVRLREWLGVSEVEFYDVSKFAIVPMGFCFPGYDKNGGDRPPMKRCAETWHQELMEKMPKLRFKILIGGYAQRWHLGKDCPKTITETVKDWRRWLANGVFVTPHPSWRNNGWLKRNPWFETELLPELRAAVARVIGQ